MMDEALEIKNAVKGYYDSWFHINKLYQDWAAAHGTQENILFTLIELLENPQGCSHASLCAALFLPKQTVSFIVGRLEKQGFVTQERWHEDHRTKLVRLTEKGAQYAAGLYNELETAELRAYGSLSSNQREAITTGLRLLSGALEKSFKNQT